MDSKPLRMWRCHMADDGIGIMVYFDPHIELLTLRDLTEDEKSTTLDKLSSVSGLIRSDQAKIVDGCIAPGDPLQGLLRFLKDGEADHG